MPNPPTFPPRPPASRLISAFYAGKCRACGVAVSKGDNVYFAKHYGVRCPSCGPHPADAERLPARKAGKPASSAPAPLPAPSRDPAPGTGLPAERCPDGVHRYAFDSVTDAVADALSDHACNDANRERVRQTLDSALSGTSKWGNRFTRTRFLRELSSPDESLLRAVDEMRERLLGALDLPTTPRRKVRRGLDHGDELDADRYLSREPDAWERSVRESQPRRTVTIGCNATVSASTRPEQLLYRGAAALALADLLAAQGCNVGITLFMAVGDPSSEVSTGVIRYTVKDPLMPLDLGSVAFAVCEIAFSRVVVACGGSRHWPGNLSSGWGHPVSVPAADREGVDFLIDADCLSRSEAEAWLRAQMQNREVAHV